MRAFVSSCVERLPLRINSLKPVAFLPVKPDHVFLTAILFPGHESPPSLPCGEQRFRNSHHDQWTGRLEDGATVGKIAPERQQGCSGIGGARHDPAEKKDRDTRNAHRPELPLGSWPNMPKSNASAGRLIYRDILDRIVKRAATVKSSRQESNARTREERRSSKHNSCRRV